MGYVWLALLGMAALAALWLFGVARSLWPAVGAALMLGAAGYAWQGRPTLTGTLARPDAESSAVEPALVDLRERLMGRFTQDTAYFVAADAMTRSGNRDAAATVMLAGVRKLPRSFIVWTGLGTTLAARDGEQVSPASLLAFQQAARLAPEHPAPPFYLGLAYARAGDAARAAGLWRRAITLSPESATYRRDMTMLLRVLEASQGSPDLTTPPPS